MPAVQFQIEWPDGQQELCYSPSSVIKRFLSLDQSYPLEDFMARSRAALQEGSQRVQAKFGYPCSLALDQLKHLETMAKHFQDQPEAKVKLIQFIEST